MKSLVIATAFAFATMTSVGMAGERGPQKLTEAQMDQVTAGDHGLIEIQVGNVASDNQVNVAIPVGVAVAANVLTIGSAAEAVSRPGRITQSTN